MCVRSFRSRQRHFRSAVFRHNLRTIVLPAGLIVLLALAGLIWMQVYLPRKVGQDLQGAVLHTGIGTITGTTDILTGYKTSVPGYMLKVNDQTVQARAEIPARIGQQVKVNYRIGKSGRIYIKNISVLTESN